MIPQHLSNCLWAAANLQESLPVVLTFVPSVADRIPNQVERMIPQALSNCLWAAAYLQEAAPAALTAVPAIVKCIPRRVDRMILQELSNCLWLGSPVVPFTILYLFFGYWFPDKRTRPKKGALIIIWLLGYQGGQQGICKRWPRSS